MPRTKKPPVVSEKRQEWLQRNEMGESPPKIAKKDSYDARTVRKHLDIARQERESKEARSTVLRSALESHYADLCHYAESLITPGEITEFNIDKYIASLPGQYQQQLGIALKQHIPRSPIWGYLSQRKKLYESKSEVTKELDKKIESNISSDPELQKELTAEESAVIPGMIAGLKNQAQQWAAGSEGLDPDSYLIYEPAENDLVNLRYGAFTFGKVRKDRIEFLRRVLKRWIASIEEWDEYLSLEKTTRDLKRVEENIRDEVAVIALRRVVPGRCRYCPL